MIHTIKKSSNIAFQNKARFCVVFTNFSNRFRKPQNTFVSTLTNPARKRSCNEGFIENWIKNFVYSVMNNSVSNGGFMNMPSFRVSNVETFIRSVLVFFTNQISMKLKDILFQMISKLQHIIFIVLTLFKFIPSQKKIFGINYLIK